MLFLVDDAFGDLCAKAARRLVPGTGVVVAESSALKTTLAAHPQTLVIWPSQKPLLHPGSIEADRNARETGAMYIPIVASLEQLLVGPLFGPERSCPVCWNIRQLHLAKMAVDRNSPTEQPWSPNTSHIKPMLGDIAISAIVSLVRRERVRFTSPYLLYKRHSRHVWHGTLTSAHECDTCRGHLRSIEGGNATLRELIRKRSS
jgi:hypothetical protein